MTYKNLSDIEREKYNLPPSGFQGNEFTVVLQAPTITAMTQKIAAFRTFATKEGYGELTILTQGADPDGGYKAVITAHNFNPVTWASEQFHRAKLGIKEGAEQGRKKAAIRHKISQEADLAATQVRETALQRARVARIAAAAPIREETAAIIGEEQELILRKRRLAELKRQGDNPQSSDSYIFGSQLS